MWKRSAWFLTLIAALTFWETACSSQKTPAENSEDIQFQNVGQAKLGAGPAPFASNRECRRKA
jgi:hypothetical protein